MKGVNGHWEIGVATKPDGNQDDRITGEALEVWKRQRMDILRTAAIKDVNARVESGELNSFADVHKVIVPAPSAGEYRYGEEFEGTFPGKGEHWVTTADEMVRKADQADLAVLSSQITATPIDDALVEKEAARLYTRIEDLKKCRAQVVALGMPSCKFAIERRITDIERNKQVLEARVGGDVQALLNAKLRVDRMLQSNLRDERRKTNSVAKKKKGSGPRPLKQPSLNAFGSTSRRGKQRIWSCSNVGAPIRPRNLARARNTGTGIRVSSLNA